MMNKYVRSAILLNKTKTLRIIKPLNCTFSHLELLLTVCDSTLESLNEKMPVHLYNLKNLKNIKKTRLAAIMFMVK
jgi:hypothetical protein